jgi:hypothetical protein
MEEVGEEGGLPGVEYGLLLIKGVRGLDHCVTA